LGDLEVVAQFNIALAKETESLELEPPRVRAGVEALLRDPAKGTYFVAVSGGEVVGQLLITHEWSDWRNGDFWWLQSVYVREDFRRRGVFKALFAFVQGAAAGATDVCGLRLYMEEDNNRAREAYRRMGMTETHYHVFERALPR
jgi:GNAT superfamily N-acetyltransferase